MKNFKRVNKKLKPYLTIIKDKISFIKYCIGFKLLMLIIAISFTSCKPEKEVLPANPELLVNGDFINPWMENKDFVGSCGCKPLNNRAWVLDPLNNIQTPAMVFLTTYKDSINGPLMHQKYYTNHILEPGESYQLTCTVYDVSVNPFRVYNLDGELIKEFESNNQVQSVTFISSGTRIRFEGISAVGKMSIKKYICNN